MPNPASFAPFDALDGRLQHQLHLVGRQLPQKRRLQVAIHHLKHLITELHHQHLPLSISYELHLYMNVIR